MDEKTQKLLDEYSRNQRSTRFPLWCIKLLLVRGLAPSTDEIAATDAKIKQAMASIVANRSQNQVGAASKQAASELEREMMVTHSLFISLIQPSLK